MSDCSAVGNMRKNIMKLNDTQAAAQAMNAGLDVCVEESGNINAGCE